MFSVTARLPYCPITWWSSLKFHSQLIVFTFPQRWINCQPGQHRLPSQVSVVTHSKFCIVPRHMTLCPTNIIILDLSNVVQPFFNFNEGLTWTYNIINIHFSVPYSLWSGCGWRSTVKTSMILLSTRPFSCCVPTCGIASASDVWLRQPRPSSRGSRNKVRGIGDVIMYVLPVWCMNGEPEYLAT